MNLPKTFKPSSRSPAKIELRWLHEWLCENKGKYNESKKVLEFGCGVTSWVLNDSLKPEVHVVMEAFEPCIQSTLHHIPSIQVVRTTWGDIPKINYDIIFVDASTHPPKGLKPMILRAKHRVFRDDVVKYVEDFQADNALIILHDWNYKEGYKAPRRYVESKGYPLVASLKTHYGFGIYQVKK